MKARVAIVDYGMGNLGSVKNTLAYLGFGADIVDDPGVLCRYDKLILPGVGAFGDAMAELGKRGLIGPITDFVGAGKPFLGICLGMQLLLDRSEETKGVAGLGLVAGTVKRFSSKLKCPHMGWNEIEARPRERVFAGTRRPLYAYFCHSYYARPRDPRVVIGETEYGATFASVIRQDNVVGMQFHPEKSQDAGLTLLKNFIERC